MVFQKQCKSQKSLSHEDWMRFSLPLSPSCHLCSLFSVLSKAQHPSGFVFSGFPVLSHPPAVFALRYLSIWGDLFVCSREMPPRGVTLVSPVPSPGSAILCCLCVCSGVNVCCLQLFPSLLALISAKAGGWGWFFILIQSHLGFPAKRAIQ